MFATAETVGLTEWIIDDTCPVLFSQLRQLHSLYRTV